MEPSSLSELAKIFGGIAFAFGCALDGNLICAQPTSEKAGAQAVSDLRMMENVMKRSPRSAAVFRNLEFTLNVEVPCGAVSGTFARP